MAINANNFFNLEEEARTQGTLGGKKLTKEERKEAFKKQGKVEFKTFVEKVLNKKEPTVCLLYTSPSPRDATLSRMPSSA